MNDSFFLFVALNPIKTLIRVTHRNFTPQVHFFWGLLENSVGWRSENVLCPGESLNPSREQSWSFLFFWRQSQKVFWLCYTGSPGGNNYQSSSFCMFFLHPTTHSTWSFCNFIPEFLVEHFTWDVVHNKTRLGVRIQKSFMYAFFTLS